MDDNIYTILESLTPDEADNLLSNDLKFEVPSSAHKNIKKLVSNKINKNKSNKIWGGLIMSKKFIFSSLLILCLLLTGVGLKSYANKATSYVNIDINPSIEIGLNNFNRVVSVKAYNSDGESIITDIDFENLSLEETLRNVIEESISQGYITNSEDSEISITTLSKNGEVNNKIEELINTTFADVLDKANVNVNVISTNISLDRRDEAIALGISPGKLNLIQKLQELDPNIKVEDYKNLSVKEIQKAKQSLKKDDKPSDSSSDNTDDNIATPDTDNNEDVTTSDTNDEEKNKKNKLDNDKSPNSIKSPNKNSNTNNYNSSKEVNEKNHKNTPPNSNKNNKSSNGQ